MNVGHVTRYRSLLREVDAQRVAEPSSLGLDLAGWTLEEANAVSADGLTIVGEGSDPSGKTQAGIAVIPEPGTALLFGLGLIGLAGKRGKH